MRDKVMIKIILISVICVFMTIGALMISGLVSERQRYQNKVMEGIARNAIGPQSLMGPFLRIPKTLIQPCPPVPETPNIKKNCVYRVYQIIAPQQMEAFSHLSVTDKNYVRDIYRANSFKGPITIKGIFQPTLENQLPKNDKSLDWEHAELAFYVQDHRGAIKLQMKINEKIHTFLRSSQAQKNVVLSKEANELEQHLLILPLGQLAKQSLNYEINLEVAGINHFQLVPLANENSFSLTDNWLSVQYNSGTSPQEKTINKLANTLQSNWNSTQAGIDNVTLLSTCFMEQTASSCYPFTVPEFNDNRADDEPYMLGNLPTFTAFGINFLNPVNGYTLTDRSLKYAILLFGMTFGSFFIFETLKSLRIHPIQYSLVGAALLVFYLLLLSFSEYIPFGQAYTIASIACIGLITWYISHVLKSRKRAASLGALLTTLYGTVYYLLQSNNRPLLMGSVLVFGLIALVMFLTRHIDWYSLSNKKSQPDLQRLPLA